MAQNLLSRDGEIVTSESGPDNEGSRIDFLSIGIVVLSEKKIVAKVALSFILLAGGLLLFLRPTYTGQALFLPPQSAPGSGVSQLMGQLGAVGVGGALGALKNPGDIYIGILGSRSISDRLIAQFGLMGVYKTKSLIVAREKLKDHSKFTFGKDSLISIKVEDHDKKRASDMANAYLLALRDANSRLALTDASQRRVFFGEQLEREKNALADAEVELKKTQEKTGLISPGGQAQAEIQEMAQIRAEISSRQVQMASLRQGATDQNPQIVLLQSEIAGLQKELQKLEGTDSTRRPGNLQVPTAKVPELSLEYIRSQREVKYHEILFDLMAKQYETARLDEARQSPLLQVVDFADVPDIPSGPPRVLIMIAATFFGLVFGVIAALAKHAFEKFKSEPATAPKWGELLRSLGSRS